MNEPTLVKYVGPYRSVTVFGREFRKDVAYPVSASQAETLLRKRDFASGNPEPTPEPTSTPEPALVAPKPESKPAPARTRKEGAPE